MNFLNIELFSEVKLIFSVPYINGLYYLRHSNQEY